MTKTRICSIQAIGAILLACTALYLVPATAPLGAVLLTGYLGGAVAINLRQGTPLFSYQLVPVYVGIIAWAGLLLRRPALLESLFAARSAASPA
ncbi:MAG TPA: DoxX family protein [Myxococcales bacterium]|nr:DoxX family protein [Myxococcales bacterium]